MNIQQLRAQIAILQDATMDENKNFRSDYDEGRFDALSVVDALLDSLQEEPVSNDLEDAMQHNAPDNIGVDDLLYWRNGFITGAKWKTTIVSENLEEVVKKLWNEINSGHEYSVIESYNVFYGLCLDIANWQTEQMKSMAIDGRLCSTISGSEQNVVAPAGYGEYGKDGDKVKVILLRRTDV